MVMGFWDTRSKEESLWRPKMDNTFISKTPLDFRKFSKQPQKSY